MGLATSENCNEIKNASDVVLHFIRLTGNRKINFQGEAAYLKRLAGNYSPDPEERKEAYKTYARGLEIFGQKSELKSVRIFKSIESVKSFLEIQEGNHRLKRHPSAQGRKIPVEYLKKKIREQIAFLEAQPLSMKNIFDVEELQQFLGE